MKFEPRRIIYVITDSGVGGSERVILHLLTFLDRTKINPVGILVLKNKREMARQWEKFGVPVFSFGMSKWPSPKLLLSVLAVIKRLKPDIIHAFLFHSCQVSRLIHFGFPHFSLVTSPRVNYRVIPKWAQWLDRLIHSRDQVALAESTATKNFLVSDLGYEERKTVVVLNGVNTNQYQFNPENRLAWRQHWGVSNETILIGGVGRLHQQKGFDVLIKAMTLVRPARLVLVGEGPCESDLKMQAQKMGVPVIFAGRSENIAEQYSAFDIYVQSSRYEGMSNALLEAMSVGLPIVATNVDGTLDISLDGDNMSLVPPEDATLLSQKINQLIDDAEFRNKIAAGARKTAQENTTQTMIKKFENVYLKLS